MSDNLSKEIEVLNSIRKKIEEDGDSHIFTDLNTPISKNAFELSNLLKNTPCKVNLIPFNQTGTTYSRSETLRINNFAKILNENSNNIRVLIRWSKGEDIDAACGQLATNNA